MTSLTAMNIQHGLLHCSVYIARCKQCLLRIYDYEDVSNPIPVAARSKAWVCGRLLAEIVGSNPTGGVDVCML